MSQKTNLFQALPVILLATLLVVAIIYAWQEPSGPPPTGNVPAPINVGSQSQWKEGGLGLGSSPFILGSGELSASKIYDSDFNDWYIDPASTGYSALFRGKVGIGTTTPAAKLDVNGNANIEGDLEVKATTTLNDLVVNGTCTGCGGTGYWSATGTDIYNTNTGNVGIGTTKNPTARLSVHSDSLDIAPLNVTYFKKEIILPTGYTDASSTWKEESTAYDNDLTTAPDTEQLSSAYCVDNDLVTGYLEFLLPSSIISNKIKFYSYSEFAWHPIVIHQVDVYKDGSWVNIYNDVPPDHEWVEVEFLKGVVSKARVRLIVPNNCPTGGATYGLSDRFNEFQFVQLIEDASALYIQENTGNVGIGTTDPGADKLDVRGRAYASGGWQTTNADYAEWFEKEEDIKPGDIVGINLKTGKVRKYRSGDKFIGICTSKSAFVGNRIEETDEEMAKTHALVGLLGQLEFNKSQVIIDNGEVKTIDGKTIGTLLSNGKVFIGR